MIHHLKKYFSSKDYEILDNILILFVGWRIILFLIGYLGLSLLPQVMSPGNVGWAGMDTDYFIKWANWDGGHFRGIAENGYIPFQVVFFPLYPLLIKSLMLLGIHSLWGGLIISNLAIVGALFYLYKLTAIDFDESIAKRVTFIALSFPTAFYFGAVYSESLFLFLTVGAFYYARKRSWFIALCFAALSSVTRLSGLVVILAVAVEYFLKVYQPPSIKEFWSYFLNRIGTYALLIAVSASFIEKVFTDNEFYMAAGIIGSSVLLLTILGLILVSVFVFRFLFKSINFKRFISWPILFFLLSLIPFGLYCVFLSMTQDNFFAFVQHEKLWHRHLTFPWEAPIEYFNNLWGARFFRIGGNAQTLIEFSFFIVFLVALIVSYFKLRLSYTVFFALSLLLPISTGTLSAFHRYGLVIFPVFILLALIKNETYRQVWMYFSITLLGLFTVMYINSYWVT